MATSKTLTPTNVTISIPAMTDVPDASVFSDCVNKEADAINALNSNFANVIKKKTVTATTTVSGALNSGISIDTQYVLGTRCTSRTNTFAFMRGDGYATVFTVDNNTLSILANTEVTIDFYYFA